MSVNVPTARPAAAQPAATRMPLPSQEGKAIRPENAGSTFKRQTLSHQHWTENVLHVANYLFSIIFSVAGAHAIWWFFSAENWVDPILQPYVTGLLAVGFAGLGFIITRALASRLRRRKSLFAVWLVAIAFEVVEIGSCVAFAAIGILHNQWLPLFAHSWLQGPLSVLYYVLLPVTPIFTLGLGLLDVALDHERHEQTTSAAQPVSAVSQGVSSTVQQPVIQPAANGTRPAQLAQPVRQPAYGQGPRPVGQPAAQQGQVATQSVSTPAVVAPIVSPQETTIPPSANGAPTARAAGTMEEAATSDDLAAMRALAEATEGPSWQQVFQAARSAGKQGGFHLPFGPRRSQVTAPSMEPLPMAQPQERPSAVSTASQ